MDTGRPRWHVRVDKALPDVPFPPLLLLPLMDALSAAGALRPPALHVSAAADGGVRIAFDAGIAAALPAALHYRTRVGLQAAFGAAWSIAGADSGFVIEIRGPEAGVRIRAPFDAAPTLAPGALP